MNTLFLLLFACGDKDEDTSTTEPAGEPSTEEPAGEPATEASTEPAGEPATEASTEPAEEPPPPGFCDLYADTCGEWTADISCPDWWAAAAPGTEGDSSGATQACYDYHLNVATTMTDQADIDMHCAHSMGGTDAMGAAPCTDPEPTAAEAYCSLYENTCGAWSADTTCVDWYNNAPETGDTEGAGANQACYDYHLDVAATMTDQVDIDMHCAHSMGGTDAMGAAPCTDPEE